MLLAGSKGMLDMVGLGALQGCLGRHRANRLHAASPALQSVLR